jgi:hypothetical protein
MGSQPLERRAPGARNMYGPGWNWVIAANVLLGVSQGLPWSVTHHFAGVYQMGDV